MLRFYYPGAQVYPGHLWPEIVPSNTESPFAWMMLLEQCVQRALPAHRKTLSQKPPWISPAHLCSSLCGLLKPQEKPLSPCLLWLRPVNAQPQSITVSSLLDRMQGVSFLSDTWPLSNARTYGYGKFKTWLCVCVPQQLQHSWADLSWPVFLNRTASLEEASSFSKIFLLFSQGALQLLQNPFLG